MRINSPFGCLSPFSTWKSDFIQAYLYKSNCILFFHHGDLKPIVQEGTRLIIFGILSHP